MVSEQDRAEKATRNPDIGNAHCSATTPIKMAFGEGI
jgi:hypothetical protein